MWWPDVRRTKSSAVAKLLGAVTILLAMGFVAVAGVGGWLYWDRTELRGE